MLTDPIADMLARIRDAALARHERRLFFYGAGLVLLAGVLALAVVWYARHPRAAG